MIAVFVFCIYSVGDCRSLGTLWSSSTASANLYTAEFRLVRLVSNRLLTYSLFSGGFTIRWSVSRWMIQWCEKNRNHARGSKP